MSATPVSRSVTVQRIQSPYPFRMDGWRRRMKHQRELVGLTQEQLAEKLGVKQSTIAGWEGGRREPETLQMFEDLAKALKCQPAYLLYNVTSEHEHADDWTDDERRAAVAFVQTLRGQKVS